MPGKSHPLDLTERIIRTLKANTTRTAGGQARDASPGMTRDRVAATRRVAAGAPPTAKASKIDTFDVADDSQSVFTLTYAAVAGSWNVSLGRPLDEGVDYEISGRTLTVLDPADLFLGADSQGSPWTLQVQYDYLSGVPTAPASDLGFRDINFHRSTTGFATVDAPSGLQVGDLCLVYAISKDTITGGTPSGWTQLEAPTQTSDGARTHYTASYWKVADATDLGGTFSLGATGPDAKDSTWLAVAGASSVHSSGFAHQPQAAGTSIAMPTPSASAAAVVVRVGCGRRSSTGMTFSIDRGVARQTNGTASPDDMATTVTTEDTTDTGAVASSTGTGAVASLSAATFICQ